MRYFFVIKVVRTTTTSVGIGSKEYLEDRCFMTFDYASQYLLDKFYGYRNADGMKTSLLFDSNKDEYSVTLIEHCANGDEIKKVYSIEVANLRDE